MLEPKASGVPGGLFHGRLNSCKENLMSDNRIIDAVKSADLVVRKLLAVQPGEEVVLVGDPDTDVEMMQALAGVIQSVGAEYNMVIMPTRPPETSLTMTRFIEKGLEAADVFIGLTAASGAACYAPMVQRMRKERGLRQMSMVLRDLDIWTKGGATADYEAMMKDAQRLKAAWTGAKTIHLTSPAGTDLTALLGDSKPFIECGFAAGSWRRGGLLRRRGLPGGQPGHGRGGGRHRRSGGLHRPAGYPAGVDLQSRTAGQNSRRHAGRSRPPGHHRQSRGGGQLRRDRHRPQSGQPQGRQVREKRKKAYGSVHIAIGRNTGGYGGTVDAQIHIDMVFYNGTVETDKGLLLEAGRLAV